jgi:hypothetical protein
MVIGVDTVTRLIKISNNAHILESSDIPPVLFSYETPVAWVKEGKLHVDPDYINYSNSTTRHINLFRERIVCRLY